MIGTAETHGCGAPPPAVTAGAIRRHYDVASPFYRLLWGDHIHHGLWAADESPRRAQLRLIEELARAAGIADGARVLDVGCGLGGSALYLARRRRCDVTGLTLSPVQRAWAGAAAWLAGVGRRTRFRCANAERAEFAPASFDVVWSIECTEHLFDKAGFFRRAADWLRPGGAVAVCAWLAADRPHTPDAARQIEAVCRGFLCPSLGTAGDYVGWLRAAGLRVEHTADLTARVWRTWQICRARVDRSGVRALAPWLGADLLSFLDHFDVILAAYRSGAMTYGRFVARK